MQEHPKSRHQKRSFIGTNRLDTRNPKHDRKSYLLINDGKASRALFLSFMVQGSSVETRPHIFSTFVGHIGALGVRCKSNAPDKTMFIT